MKDENHFVYCNAIASLSVFGESVNVAPQIINNVSSHLAGNKYTILTMEEKLQVFINDTGRWANGQSEKVIQK